MKLEKLLNIDNINVEDKIVDTIDETRVELRDLTTDQTCKYYSSSIKKNLNKKHLINRIVNTSDYDLPYEHQFNVALGNYKYYLIDLTYSQFKNSEFVDLLFLGYMQIDNDIFNEYLEIVGKDKCDVSLENVFSVNNKKR